MQSFTCPHCQIEQHDVVIRETYLLKNPGDRTHFFRCNSCGEILLDDEVGDFKAQYRRRERLAIIGGFIFWLIVVRLIWCWLA